MCSSGTTLIFGSRDEERTLLEFYEALYYEGSSACPGYLSVIWLRILIHIRNLQDGDVRLGGLSEILNTTLCFGVK